MYTVDVPMYFAAGGRIRRRATRYFRSPMAFATPRRAGWSRFRIEDWRWEMLWMSLYFSFGVWISVSLIRAPYPASALGARQARVALHSLTTTGCSADRR